MTLDGLTPPLTALNAEWAAFTDLPGPLPRSWQLAHPGFRRVGRSGLMDAVRADPDAALLALLVLHRQGDAAAGRVVLQAMLGKLVRMAAPDPHATFGDFLGALWERIATYPIERRPRRVAANLALDTLKALRSGTWRPTCRLADAAPDAAAPGDAAGESRLEAGAVLDAGVRLGVIDPRTREALACVYLGGRTSSAAASELGTSADAVRWRCSKGVRALRARARELGEVVGGAGAGSGPRGRQCRTSPLSKANSTSPTRSRARSLVSRRPMWVLTVPSAM